METDIVKICFIMITFASAIGLIMSSWDGISGNTHSKKEPEKQPRKRLSVFNKHKSDDHNHQEQNNLWNTEDKTSNTYTDNDNDKGGNW